MKKFHNKGKGMLLALSIHLLFTGCSNAQAPVQTETAADILENTEQTNMETTNAKNTEKNHISERITDKLVIDAEIITPENQEYLSYKLTKKAFPKEDIHMFLKAEADITENPNYANAYLAQTTDGSEFSANEGNFRYARDAKKEEELTAMIEANSYKKKETKDLNFLSMDEAVQLGREKIRELTGWDSEAIEIIGDSSEGNEFYYINYSLTKDGLPIYNGINEPKISMAVDLFWDSAVTITMLVDKDGIRYLHCRNGLFDLSPEQPPQMILSAEAALEKVKEIYSNILMDSQGTISKVWLEYISVPDMENPKQFRLSPYWCVQIDWLTEDGYLSSSAERINAVTGGDLSYGK